MRLTSTFSMYYDENVIKYLKGLQAYWLCLEQKLRVSVRLKSQNY